MAYIKSKTNRYVESGIFEEVTDSIVQLSAGNAIGKTVKLASSRYLTLPQDPATVEVENGSIYFDTSTGVIGYKADDSLWTVANREETLANTGFQTLTGSLTITGDLYVSGTTVTTNTEVLAISDNIIYLNSGPSTSINNAVGNGSQVVYTSTNNFTPGQLVTITGILPISFEVVDAEIIAADATSFTINSTVTDTYIFDGQATIKSDAVRDMGFVGATNDDGVYAHSGLFRDVTDLRYKFFQGYVPEPQPEQPDPTKPIDDININDPSFQLSDIEVNNLYVTDVNSATVNATGVNATTVTSNNLTGGTGTPNLISGFTIYGGTLD